jgi:hypothetical protein
LAGALQPVRNVKALVLACLLLGATAACQADAPPRGPEETCAKACSARGNHHCSRSLCARGCNLVIDRLAEHEGETVLACVASATACDDRTWAHCAARVGVHADGGPPPPPPPPTDVLEGED